MVKGFWFRVRNLGLRVKGFWVWSYGFMIKGLWFSFKDLRFRVEG